MTAACLKHSDAQNPVLQASVQMVARHGEAREANSRGVHLSVEHANGVRVAADLRIGPFADGLRHVTNPLQSVLVGDDK